jgi:hypothetical protein
MNEAETRADCIDPALRKALWRVVEGSVIRRALVSCHIHIAYVSHVGKPNPHYGDGLGLRVPYMTGHREAAYER